MALQVLLVRRIKLCGENGLVKDAHPEISASESAYKTHIKGGLSHPAERLLTFAEFKIQRISPHIPLAVRSVCALKKKSLFLHSPGSVNGKQSGSDQTTQHNAIPANQQQAAFVLMHRTRGRGDECNRIAKKKESFRMTHTIFNWAWRKIKRMIWRCEGSERIEKQRLRGQFEILKKREVWMTARDIQTTKEWRKWEGRDKWEDGAIRTKTEQPNVHVLQRKNSEFYVFIFFKLSSNCPCFSSP